MVVVLLLAIGGVEGVRLVSSKRLLAELTRAREEMQAGLFSLAHRRLSRLAEEQPGNAEVAYELGRSEIARGQPEPAITSWSRIPADSRWAAPAAIEAASAAIALGRIAQAERALRSAMKRPSPELRAIRHLLLVLLGQQGRFDEARNLIEDLWQQTTTIPTADVAARVVLVREHVGLDLEPFPLTWNLSQLGHTTAAADEADRQALALARAHLATSAGDFDEATTQLEFCLSRWGDDPTVWKAWLELSLMADRLEAAQQALDHLAADQVSEPGLWDLKAWLARQHQDAHGERKALERLIQIEPGRSAAISRLAELLHGSGDTEGAAHLRKRKSEIDADRDRYNRLYKEDRYFDRLLELAALAERLGRWFECRAFWELIKIREPANTATAAALARLRFDGSSRPRASATLAQALSDGLASSTREASIRGARKAAGHGPIPRFENNAATAGLAGFLLDNGKCPLLQLPEMACGGVGLIDFDGDGFLDVNCVQGGRFPPERGTFSPGDRLFRNQGDGTFRDVTESSGIAAMPRGYGHGVSVADYDNDGRPDLFVTRWKSYALYHNRGDGTFEDVTDKAGLGGDRDWPTSSAFADLDNDGDLDLYVCHYGIWDTVNPRICTDPSGTIRTTCDPRLIESLPDHVFRNDSGRFVDITAQAGIVDKDGRGLGVVAADLDGDGLVDLFVANDSTANFLYHNLGGFRFEEIGHVAGVAANAEGGYQAGMGVACGDLDGDGLPDLAVTNFYGESTSFFHNLGQGLFADHTAAIGLAAPSRYFLGFGVAFLDANNDGYLDLMTADGHVSDLRPLFPYPMTAQLYLGCAGGSLTDVTSQAGPVFQQLYVGRGLAVGDLDNDGRQGALMVAQNDPLVAFHNVTPPDGSHFTTFRLEGTKSNRDGVGAAVAITAGGRRQVAWRVGGGSYQSAADSRLHFGLGPNDRVQSVEVRWPSGKVDCHRNLAADRGYLLREGDASPRRLEGFRG